MLLVKFWNVLGAWNIGDMYLMNCGQGGMSDFDLQQFRDILAYKQFKF